MEDALLQTVASCKDVSDDQALFKDIDDQALLDDDEEDLPTPPATPPIEERLKSPMSTTSRSPPSPTVTMTPTKKV